MMTIETVLTQTGILDSLNLLVLLRTQTGVLVLQLLHLLLKLLLGGLQLLLLGLDQLVQFGGVHGLELGDFGLLGVVAEVDVFGGAHGFEVGGEFGEGVEVASALVVLEVGCVWIICEGENGEMM